MGFVSGAASDVILFQQARELDPVERCPAALQAGEKFEFAASEYRHGETGMPKSGTTPGETPLDLLHSGVLPAAVGADMDPCPHALRFRRHAHLRSVGLAA
jgi:hypothetical protein